MFFILFPVYAGGGFVVTPVNNGQKSLVKHMLAVDWKCWKLYLSPSSARSITVRMLERVAGNPLKNKRITCSIHKLL